MRSAFAMSNTNTKYKWGCDCAFIGSVIEIVVECGLELS